MYSIKTECSFDSAHFLANYNGKCGNIHGHRWKIIFEITQQSLKEEGEHSGMIVDFGYFKKDVKSLVEPLDHALIIEKNSLKTITLDCLKNEGFNIIEVDFRPTAENFAKYFYNLIQNIGYPIKRVTVYETPNNCAVFEQE